MTEQSTTEFLANEVYLPGYMALANQDYDKKGATFDFNVREPPVARGDIVHYLTPRGLHICISQAGYALTEQMVNEELMDGYSDPEIYKKIFKAIGEVPEAKNPHKVRLRKQGYMFVIDMDIEVDGNLSVKDGHDISIKVGEKVKEHIKNVYDINKGKNRLLFLANESRGPSDKLLSIIDKKITIPGKGKAESLNVASASAIILAELTK